LTGSAKTRSAFQSLCETAINTTTSHGRLTISILASIAELERKLLRDRIVVAAAVLVTLIC
jgi:DNA invertase Pin-like site-specific DNA recombinase